MYWAVKNESSKQIFFLCNLPREIKILTCLKAGTHNKICIIRLVL